MSLVDLLTENLTAIGASAGTVTIIVAASKATNAVTRWLGKSRTASASVEVAEAEAEAAVEVAEAEASAATSIAEASVEVAREQGAAAVLGLVLARVETLEATTGKLGGELAECRKDHAKCEHRVTRTERRAASAEQAAAELKGHVETLQEMLTRRDAELGRVALLSADTRTALIRARGGGSDDTGVHELEAIGAAITARVTTPVPLPPPPPSTSRDDDDTPGDG